jgi:drug/metabolite transporter (DMT)-like permease
MSSPINRALLALFLAAVISGLNPLLVRYAAIDPAATGFWRVAVTLPLFLLWPAPAAAKLAPPVWSDRLLLILAGAAYGADLVVWYWSITLTSVANAQLFAYTYPLMVAVAAALMLGQRMGLRGWSAIALGLAGAAFVVAGGGAGLAGLVENGIGIGDALGFAAAGCYTVTLLIQGTVRGRVGTRQVLLDGTLGALLVLLPAALFGPREFLPPDMGQWALIAVLGLLTFASQLLVIYALASLPVVLAAISGTLSVGVAAASGWLLLGEPLGLLQGVGVAVVLAAILMAERKPTSRPRAPDVAPTPAAPVPLRRAA